MDRLAIDASFRPAWWLRGPTRQSILAGFPFRRAIVQRRALALLAASREILLDCGDGVRLQAFHASPASRGRLASHSVAVLVHGWEGSADSLYILSLATDLFEQGYDVVRLNLRDHGATHHLNRELFHSCRLPEFVGALRALQQQFGALRMVLAGYSLGGNFVLRAAAEAPQASLKLDRVVAVSPLLDPAPTMQRLERRWSIYHQYFVLKWGRSLLKKQRAWPADYALETIVRSRNLRLMTRELVMRFTEFPDEHSYFAAYAITGDRLQRLQVPSTIIAAMDDPIIPVRDFDRLASPDCLRVVLTHRGGHCGFLSSLSTPSWANAMVIQALAADDAAARHSLAHAS